MASIATSFLMEGCIDAASKGMRETRPEQGPIDGCSKSAPDEPRSKRLRAMPLSHAEVVRDTAPGSGASCTTKRRAAAALLSHHQVIASAPADGKDAQSGLVTGTCVRLRGFNARPQLNGQIGKLEGFHAGHLRWVVSFEDGSVKLILAANLQPAEQTATTITPVVARGSGAEISMTAGVEAREHLKAALECTRQQGLRSIEEKVGKTCAEISQLRSDVQQCCSRNRQHLLQYCQMSKENRPKNHDQQLARNTVREGLLEGAQTVQASMQRLLEASLEPKAALHRAKANMFESIDGNMDMLMKLRSETAACFEEYAEKLEVDSRATEAMIKSLAPAIEDVDSFMQCFSEEVQHENAEAESLYQELLEKLQNDEARYVEINTPAWDPLFTKVRDDLAALNQRLEDQSATDASHISLMQSWDSVMQGIPSKQDVVSTTEPEPPKRTFWRQLKCSNRAVPAST